MAAKKTSKPAPKPVKQAAKPKGKVAAKKLVKTPVKPVAKSKGKPAAKPVVKAAVKGKAAAKPVGKVSAKPAIKAKAKTAAKPAVKAKGKRKPNPALMKPVQPDAVLAAVVGSKAASRGQLTKSLWAYIKKNGLQDAKNKRNINADDKLKAVFGGKKQVTMFEMTKLVSKHIGG